MANIPHLPLQTYLAGLGSATLLASTANAAIVVLDVSSISEVNAGLAPGGSRSVSMDSISAGGLFGTLNFYNNAQPTEYDTVTGIGGTDVLFALVGGSDYPPNPTLAQFQAGYEIANGDMQFGNMLSATAFYFKNDGMYPESSTQPDWGAGSYLGFTVIRESDSASLNGWMEVTWNSSTMEFQILSGAYEDVAGVPIAAGAIPEPSSLALLVAGAAGVTYLRRRRKAA